MRLTLTTTYSDTGSRFVIRCGLDGNPVTIIPYQNVRVNFDVTGIGMISKRVYDKLYQAFNGALDELSAANTCNRYRVIREIGVNAKMKYYIQDLGNGHLFADVGKMVKE